MGIASKINQRKTCLFIVNKKEKINWIIRTPKKGIVITEIISKVIKTKTYIEEHYENWIK